VNRFFALLCLFWTSLPLILLLWKEGSPSSDCKMYRHRPSRHLPLSGREYSRFVKESHSLVVQKRPDMRGGATGQTFATYFLVHDIQSGPTIITAVLDYCNNWSHIVTAPHSFEECGLLGQYSGLENTFWYHYERWRNACSR
jgi:hypothetical protein